MFGVFWKCSSRVLDAFCKFWSGVLECFVGVGSKCWSVLKVLYLNAASILYVLEPSVGVLEGFKPNVGVVWKCSSQVLECFGSVGAAAVVSSLRSDSPSARNTHSASLLGWQPLAGDRPVFSS